MDRAFLKCRSQGHRWSDDSPYIKVPGSKPEAATQTLECERCGSARIDRMVRRYGGRWEFEARYYDYADGYLIDAEPDERPSKADCRAELAHRDLD